MHLSVLLPSLPLDFAAAVKQVEQLGFTHVDVVALADRPAAHREVLAETNLLVSCASLGRDLPEGCTLDSADLGKRQNALEQMKRHIIDAAQLGATHAYLIPGHDGSEAGLLRFADACGLLINFAGNRQIQLCVEHFPGRALPSVAATLDWLDRYGLDHLHLLLDVGHCLISKEDPSEAILRARPRLGYVHFDDNDGVSDLHWPLLAGRLTESMIHKVVSCLQQVGYTGGVALELHPTNANPVENLASGKVLLERGWRGGGY